MRYSELISLYFERSNALQNYWTLYVVVIGGLLAISSIRRDPDIIAGLLVTALFCGFAYKNLDAIHDVTLHRYAALAGITQFDPQSVPQSEGNEIRSLRPIIEPTLKPPAYEGVRNFHIACDIATIATVWAMQWRRWKKMRRNRSRAPEINR